MPTIYQDRSPISLYDAQHDVDGNLRPIPATIITDVVAALLRFKSTCQHLGVPLSNISIVATEATRNARNRDDLLGRIEKETGWPVSLLPKEEEGALGAIGIASSVDRLNGICIDMGGGSLQLTPVIAHPDGDIWLGPSVSYPYGAAALMKGMDKLDHEGLMQLLLSMETSFKHTLEDYLLDPSVRAASEHAGGIRLYLSGGGFRGLGHLLMSQEKNFEHYPIPFINGYTVDRGTFFSAASFFESKESIIKTTSHRISTRRASQLPAVQLVVEALLRTGVEISEVTFTQGGVREGLIYKDMPCTTRALPPIVAATVQYRLASAAALYDLLRLASPRDLINEPLLQAIINLLYAHGTLTKDVRAVAALRSTTVGILATAHGLSHYDRAMLALILCERWGGNIPAADVHFYEDMAKICGPRMHWYAKFVGRIGKGIASLYPAGIVELGNERISIVASFPPTSLEAPSLGPGSNTYNPTIRVKVLSRSPKLMSLVAEWKADLEKLSKKKHWGSDPKWGLEVQVMVI